MTSAVLYAVVSLPAQAQDAVPEDVAALSHHNKKGGFINPWTSFKDVNLSLVLKVLRSRFTSTGWSDPKGPTVPVHNPTFLPSRDTPVLRATWLGHACYYLEFPTGLRVLFDPVFTDRCSPFSFLGPKRFTTMPCAIKDIPYIDAVVISHNHYDHLSLPTIKEIQHVHPNVRFFAPLGNKAWFDKCGIKNMIELDWWQSAQLTLSSDTKQADVVPADQPSPKLGDIVATISCLPSQHGSARTPFDRASTLWASWSVKTGDSNIWFAGDTGYRAVPEQTKEQDASDYDKTDPSFPHCPAFAQIGRLRGPFDLGLIPIGAYSPRFFMSPLHANPFDSVNIFSDTRCKRALGMHWGTWVLTDEPVMEPPKLLRAALASKGIAKQGVFDVCDIGESREFVRGGD